MYSLLSKWIRSFKKNLRFTFPWSYDYEKKKSRSTLTPSPFQGHMSQYRWQTLKKITTFNKRSWLIPLLISKRFFHAWFIHTTGVERISITIQQSIKYFFFHLNRIHLILFKNALFQCFLNSILKQFMMNILKFPYFLIISGRL